jgi:1,4-dihydroxy-2-naphthoate octaprenyltransferase
MTEATATRAVAAGSVPRWWVYWKLAKYRIDVDLGVFIAWAMIPAVLYFEPRTLLLIALSFVFFATISCTAIVFDDVTGFRDGSDAKNYNTQDVTGYRPQVKKPLVAGLLTEPQAIRFGLALWLVSISLVVLTWFLAGSSPWWVLAGLLAMALFSTQYSYGMKLSYLGLQDFVLFFSFFGTTVLPFGLITGEVTPAVLILASVLGLWDVQVVQFSNIPDAKADGEAGRRTMAVLLSTRAHNALIVFTFLLIWAGTVWGVLAHGLSWLTLLALVPAAVIHLVTLRAGLDSDPHRAYRGRILGWVAMRAWTAGVVVACLAGAFFG